MKAVWVSDHIFRVDQDGAIFSPGKQPADIWRRYLRFFNQLIVIGRSSPIAKGESSSNLVSSETKDVSFEFVPSLASAKSLLRNRTVVRAIIERQLRDSDCLIARIPSLTGTQAIAIAQRLGKPYALEIVACAWGSLWNYGNLQGKLWAPFAHWTAKREAAEATHAIFVTREFLQRHYPCHGISEHASDVALPPPNSRVLKSRLEAPGGKTFVFGQMGYYDAKYKGIHVALKALARVQNQLGSFEYRVIGSGDPTPWRALAEDLGISKHVRLQGVVPTGQPIYDWLDDLDVYLHPSLIEGLPRAVIEAMSRGCPALGSFAGGIPELLDKACLHRPGDIGKLATDILRMHADTVWRKQQCQRNFNIALDYTSDKMDMKRELFWSCFSDYVRKTRKYIV